MTKRSKQVVKTRLKQKGNKKVRTQALAGSKERPKSEDRRKEELKKLYYLVRLTREFDDRGRKLWRQGRMEGTFFSQIGQEATTVVPTFFTEKNDFIGPQHRELGAIITKGCPLELLASQVLSRPTSQDKGKCHPVFWGWTEGNFLAPCTLMAAQTGVAVGAALSFKMRGIKNLAINFSGEGGTSKGQWHEAVNFASVHKLPVVFIVQNNWWAESVPLRLQAGNENISQRAIGYGIEGFRVDGNDVVGLYEFFGEWIPKIRENIGPPIIVQLDTYRWYGHSEIDPADYRPADEVEKWKKKDPIIRFEKYLLKEKIMTAEEIAGVQARVLKEVEQAYEFALTQPDPRPEICLEDVYA